MSMDDKKAIHYNITDDMMLNIISLFRRGQAVFEEVSGLLYRAEDICENLPASVREQELIIRAQDMNHKLSNYDCEYEGQIIVSSMQRLIDGLYEVENTYTNEIRENSACFQSDVWWSGTGQAGTEHIETMSSFNPEQAEIKALSDYITESVYKIAEIRQETGHLSDAEIATYFNAIHSYIQRVCPYEYMLYTTDGIPTTVQQRMYEKLKDMTDVYVEAVQLQSQLLTMEYPYAWNAEFLSMENILEISEIFYRNEVYENDKKALFLSQIYVETFGGKYTREKLGGFSEDIDLDIIFDENLASLYVLDHSANYLGNYSENTSLSEEEFSNILYSQNREHYTCNNLVIQRINELKTHIGNVPASPYEISDLIKYRGAGVLQLTHKENYYRFAHYIEVTYRDVEAAQDIRENGCYSEYIMDKYCFISAEWYYFIGPNRVDEDDMIEQVTENILGARQDEREKVYEAIYNVISE